MGGRNASGVSLLLVCLCAVLASCAASPARPDAPPEVLSSPGAESDLAVHDRGRSLPAVVDSTLETRVWALGNRARREAGVDSLVLRLDLVDVARRHALDMASRDYFSHVSPEGEGPGARADRGGTSFVAYAENLARVRNSERPATLAIEAWMASPGHRKNLLDERDKGYRYTGIGVARASDGTVLIAQVFLR